MLADITYTTCVRRESGYCGIEWAPSGDESSADSFDLNVDNAPSLSKLTGTTAGTDYSVAYITLPGSYVGIYGGGALSDDIVIVDTISSTVQAYGQPFMITVNTHGVAAANTRGYSLVYNQLPCGGGNIDRRN